MQLETRPYLKDTTVENPVARRIWRSKYQYRSKGRIIDQHVAHTWKRVAQGLAAAETPDKRAAIEAQFYDAMSSYRLLPGGRILSGCGTARHVTLSNTFVMRTIPDSVEGIMDTAKQAALTMKMGGGIGFDFSTVRPKGGYVKGLDCAAAGPLAAMEICDAVCKMVLSGMGRGAMMATLRCDHPDIEAFITAKEDSTRLRNFNVSVLVTDPFMEAVHKDEDWDLIWNGWCVRTVKARELWQMILRKSYESAEPGVLFIDRINALNPLNYLEEISSTNSCAEQPLPPNGTCPLASINLARLVHAPFQPAAALDLDELRRLAAIAVRMLDNAIDISEFAVHEQEQEAKGKRRIGVGVTGLADALIMLGVRYGSDEAAKHVSRWMRTLQNAAYLASANLAAERGAFPLYDRTRHQKHATIQKLDPEVRQAIMRHGLRNGLLTTVAPTGTTSMYAGNVSSGIEPVFAISYKRAFTKADGSKTIQNVEDYAVWLYRQLFGPDADLPDAMVTAMELDPHEHVAMQAAAQAWVDSAISKTVNCPEDITFEQFEHVYMKAYESGCKGCTTFRPNPITGSILSV
ncbi:adenosylcobalamin-dependent ribonucleoside-diphosphate reductase [Roseovarius sp. 2305UL8-3]|uniref:adenosylcobalamin-dependent ribonucleoside-diphosphate reductase n=1 Tax=Roseovarius conchicola TaxID=3121636 RepID=UPI00352919C4